MRELVSNWPFERPGEGDVRPFNSEVDGGELRPTFLSGSLELGIDAFDVLAADKNDEEAGKLRASWETGMEYNKDRLSVKLTRETEIADREWFGFGIATNCCCFLSTTIILLFDSVTDDVDGDKVLSLVVFT